MSSCLSSRKPHNQSVEHVEQQYPQDKESMSVGEDIGDDHETERRLKLKMDWIIIPLASIAYLLATMGRSDLGNAKIAGMTDDLGISDQQYATISGMYYLGGLLLQLPSTLMVRKITPPVQLFLAMIIWGTLTCCLVVAKNYGTVLALRVLIGAAEALNQGIVYYLSYAYRPRELAKRIAFVFSFAALAGGCNGLIAYGVEMDLDGKDGFAAWQWLFLIEGVIPIGFSFVVLALFPSNPETTRLYFTAEEKALMVRRSREAQNTGESKFQPKLILKLFLDPIFWLLVCLYSGLNFGVNSLANFLPAIIESFGWSSERSQAMSVIVYAIAFVTTNFWAIVSDRIGQRGIIISLNALLAAVGFILLITLENDVGLFVAACLTLGGLYPAFAITVAWIPNIFVGHMYRASGLALVIAFSQAVAISANQAYKNSANDYRTGNISGLSVTLFTSVLTAGLSFWLRRLNKAKARNSDSPEAEEMRRSTVDELGHKHPDFYFTY